MPLCPDNQLNELDIDIWHVDLFRLDLRVKVTGQRSQSQEEMSFVTTGMADCFMARKKQII